MEQSAANEPSQPPRDGSSLSPTTERTASFIGELGKSGSSAARRHSDEAVTTLQSMEEITKELNAKDQAGFHQLNLHHLAVLKKHLFLRKLRNRSSTGSLLHLTASTIPPAAATATDKDDQRYEEMMGRFQIRRLQPTGAEESGDASQCDFRRGSRSAIYRPSQGDPQGSGAPFESRSSLPNFSGRSLSRSPSKYGRLQGSLFDTRATHSPLTRSPSRRTLPSQKAIDSGLEISATPWSSISRDGGIPDLLSSIPIHFVEELATKDHPLWSDESILVFDVVLHSARPMHLVSIVGLLWDARSNHTGKSVWAWFVYSRYSHLFRIAWIILFILLVSHYVACGWILLGGRNELRSSPAEEYTSSFYDALQLLQGQGVPTTTTSQSIFASFAVLLGSVVLAIVFGHVTVLVSNFNANSTNYQRKMEAVFAITSKMQLPESLRERIHQYYDHLWREYESLDGEIERFSKNLSHTLELEVVLCKYMDLIMGIPFWVDCSPDFQKQLMLNLRVRVYLPDDFIMRRGEVDEEFYMINRGSVELATGPDSFERSIGGTRALENCGSRSDMSGRSLPNHSNQRGSTKMAGSGDLHRPHRHDPNRSIYRVDNFVDDALEASLQDHTSETHHSDNRRLQVLTKGQAFGEMALLMNYQRTADVRAITYVEMCVLNRKDFQRILIKRPEDRKKVMSTMLSGCMVSNEAEAVFCPLKEMVRSVYSEHDLTRGVQVSAKEAAALILDVINPSLEDKSIKFGVNSKLKNQLLRKKRDADAKAEHQGTISTEQSVASVSPVTDRAPVANAPSTASAASNANADFEGSSALETRIEQIEQSLDNLLVMMVEMRSAVTRMSIATPSTAPPQSTDSGNDRLSVSQAPHDGLFEQEPITRDRPREQRQEDRLATGSSDGATLPAEHQGSRLSRSQTAFGERLFLYAQNPSLLAKRKSILPGLSTLITTKPTTPSPTQYVDQLFRARPRAIFFRHSAESVESPYSLNSTSLKKLGR